MAGDLEVAWNIVTGALGAKNSDPPDDEILHEAVDVLHNHGMASVVQPWFLESVQQHLASNIAARFWSHFQTALPDDRLVHHMRDVFQELHMELSALWPCLDRLDMIQTRIQLLESRTLQRPGLNSKAVRTRTPREQLMLDFKAILFYNSTKHFQDAICKLYFKAFKAFDASTSNDSNLDDSELEDSAVCLKCDVCERVRESCECQQILDTFHLLNSQLRNLGLLDRLSGEAVSKLIHQRIKHHVENTCRGNFETQFQDSLEEWLETKVVGWLELIFSVREGPKGSLAFAVGSNPITAHKERLAHYMYEVYGQTHIDQLFTIIIEYPESLPALSDLKVCLEKTNLRRHLVQTLRHALETRLLHPGVNTSDILTAYINAIKALKVLDPSGVLLDLVCEPVRRYLRHRDDTVRCVVSNLTEEGSSELSEELIRNQSVIQDEQFCAEDDTTDWENWTPDPVDADPDKMSSSRRSSDIISMLINIYGSKELFVNEYRTLLADRILAQFSYDTEKEIRYQELLKLKFGETQLHYCEVMLKDVADSKRINMNISDQREKEARLKQTKDTPPADTEHEEVPVNGMILSAEFWPSFREEKIELPEYFQKQLQRFTKSFEALKGNRTLNWKPHLGQMNIDIELKGKTLNMSVSPVHATILWHFQEKARWTVEELGWVLHMPCQALRRKIAFWQSHGLLKEESTDTFLLVEEVKGRGHEVALAEEEDEAESAMATAQDQKEEELQVIWQYVVGMLTNLESLPLERIHSMLKMFAMQGPGSDCTLQDLRGFLDRKVKEQKLVFGSGVYRLPKTSA